jgi:F-type H+-transporting ATPase subunit c
MTRKALSSIVTFFGVLLMSSLAFAQGVDPTQAEKIHGLATNYGWFALAAGIAIGVAALGGGIGQGRAAAAALDGIARNPGAAGQIRGPMILGLALIESLVIYALIIAILLWLKIS